MSAKDDLLLALTAKGLKYVGTRGNTSSNVAVIGEAPGVEEDHKGLPFIGASGYLLDSMLKESGFATNQTWFFNAYQTRPPDNKMPRLDEYGIPHVLFHNHFLEVLRQHKPSIIVSCGKTPTNLLVPRTRPRAFKGKSAEDKDGFGSWRGSLLESPLLNWPHYVIPMYHPAFVLRNYSEREICIFILTRAFEEFSYLKQTKALQPLPVRSIITNPSYDIAVLFLERCIASRNPISVDIELLRRKVPYTISFALSPTEAISLSFWKYPPDQLRHLWRLMDVIFTTKRQIGQNYTTFDAHWLRALGFTVNLALVDDTLVRHHVLWPGLRHKLEFQTMQYTREPFYKDEGKGWSQKDDINILMSYNCKDTLVTYEIFNEQEVEFNDRKT